MDTSDNVDAHTEDLEKFEVGDQILFLAGPGFSYFQYSVPQVVTVTDVETRLHSTGTDADGEKRSHIVTYTVSPRIRSDPRNPYSGWRTFDQGSLVGDQCIKADDLEALQEVIVHMLGA